MQELAFDEGRTFLARAAAHYDRVLAFDHPTLSVSPILNALDLAQALALVLVLSYLSVQ